MAGTLKRGRDEPPAPAPAAAEPDDYEPISFEDAVAEVRPAQEPIKARRELFVGNLDRRVTECVLSVISPNTI